MKQMICYSLIYKVWSKYIKTEVVFTKTEMNNERNINSLQVSYLDIQPTYFSEFSFGQSTSKLF